MLHDIVCLLVIVIHANHLAIALRKICISFNVTLYRFFINHCNLISIISLEYEIKCIFYCMLYNIVHFLIVVLSC